jgi:chaperonin GroEL (HSP60 family)
MESNYEALVNEIKMGMNLIEGSEYKDALIAISDIASDMLKKTLGPYAHTTILDDGTFRYPTKDGWATLSRIHFGDATYQALFDFIKDISFSLVSKVGDGTTTAIVAANQFIKEMSKYGDKLTSYRQADMLKIITAMKDLIIKELTSPKYTNDIRDSVNKYNILWNIAYTSSNGNTALANIIQRIYEETDNPNIYVTIDPGRETYAQMEVGYKLDCKMLNPNIYFNTDNKTYDDKQGTLLAIFDHNVTYADHARIITVLSRIANNANKTIVIMAPYFDDVISNMVKASIDKFVREGILPSIMLVQVPFAYSLHRLYLSDFAMLTKTPTFDYGKVKLCYKLWNKAGKAPDATPEEKGIEAAEEEMFTSAEELIQSSVGIAPTISISEKYCLIQDYDTNNPDYINTLKEVAETYRTEKKNKDKSTTISDKAYADAYSRFTKLYGNMGSIHVGGDAELEKHCLKDSVDDAVLACRSAYENGYVKGLNLTTLTVIKDLIAKTEDPEEKEILQILYNVFFNTSLCVMRNKHEAGEKVWQFNNTGIKVDYKLPEKSTDEEILNLCITNNLGYNIRSESYETDSNLSVINSVSTDVEILNAVTSILSLILTSNQFLSMSKLYDKKAGRRHVLAEKAEEYNILANAFAKGLSESGIKITIDSPNGWSIK